MDIHAKKHFIDLIPGPLRDRLYARGMITHQVRDKSLLNKLRPPPELRPKLLPLHGLCTYKLVEDLRYGDVTPVEWDTDTASDSIGGWFTQLRETTSEWTARPPDKEAARWKRLAQQGMLYHQWRCMGEELLALDKSISVRRDAAEIREIYKVIKSIPEYIASKLKNKYNLTMCDVIPIGSYQGNAKIIDVDEFDFLLLTEREIQEDAVKCVFPFTDVDINELASVGSGKYLPHDPHVVSVYSHGPATCVELAWTCTESHFHVISIDVTIAKASSGLTLKSVLQICHEQTMLTRLLKEAGDTGVVDVKGFHTTAVLDAGISRYLDELSPNILAAYRIMKLICAHALPKSLSILPGQRTFRRVEASPTFSSYQLKQLLLFEFFHHQNAKDWEPKALHRRVAAMLLKILIPQAQFLELYNREDSANRDEMFGRRMKSIECQKFISGSAPVLWALFGLLRGAYGSHHSMHGTPNIPDMVLVSQSAFHICERALCEERQMYIAPSTPVAVYTLRCAPMLYPTHPLVHWMRTSLPRQLDAGPDLGLRKLNMQDMFFIWMLHQAGQLSLPADTDTIQAAVVRFTQVLSAVGPSVGRAAGAFSLGMRKCNEIKLYTEAYPAEYSNPLPRIQTLIKVLAPSERRLLYRWVTGLRGTDRDSLFFMYGTSRKCQWGANIRAICESVDVASAVLHRSGSPGMNRAYSSDVLLWHVVRHLLNHGVGLLQADPDPVEEAKLVFQLGSAWDKCTRDVTMSHWEGGRWQVIRVEQGFFSFYRCLVSHGRNGFRSSKRLTSGKLIEMGSFYVECVDVHAYRRWVRHYLEGALWNRDYREGVRPRARAAAREVAERDTTAPDTREMSAAAWVEDRQIHVYEERDGVLTLVSALPAGALTEKQPVSLLLTRASGGYDLLVPPDGYDHWPMDGC